MPDPSWIFGYGSLIWKQDFPFVEARPAFIRGWQRRFWQGSPDHRGSPDAPGRVVTLVPSAGAICRGMAFRVRGGDRDEILRQLDHRERGGYRRVHADLFVEGHPLRGVVYAADEANPNFLGPAELVDMARQVLASSGQSGANAEYVTRLARSLREIGADDAHVFELEACLLKMG